MARVTVYIEDALLQDVKEAMRADGEPDYKVANVSGLVQEGLRRLLDRPGRPERSERGRLETLRAIRAARAALDETEEALTQGRPVRRRARRV